MRHSKPIENGLGEQGLFTYWDPEVWEKNRKEFTVMYADLEDRLQPTVQQTGVGMPNQTGSVQSPSVAQLGQQSQSRPNFTALGMTAAAM